MSTPRLKRSKPEEALLSILEALYPNDVIVEQMAIQAGRTTLFVDFVIKDRQIAFEIDGRQHDEFVEHFHRDTDGFKASKARDQLKERWLEQNGYALVRIKHDEKIDRKTIRQKLLVALR